jgi:replicative DNA helicase
MAVDALPPQDVETEAAALASALLNRDALLQVTEILREEDFYLDKHRIIYSSIIELDKKNLPVDLTTLKQRLVDNGHFDTIGGDAALVELYQTVSTSANARYYAQRISELSLRRRMISVATDAVTKCYDTSRETKDLIDEIESDIFKIAEQEYSDHLKALSDILVETKEQIEYLKIHKKMVTGVGSGFTRLDEMLTGFHATELIIIAARPGMGKTALALNIINHIALKEKKASMFFSLEMPASQLATRLLCIEAMVDSQRVRTGHISDDELKKLHMANSRLSMAPVYIDDSPAINILDIKRKARRLAQREDLGIIIVDYLQLMSSVDRRLDRHLQIAEISRSLKQLARELNIPIVALSQLSRAVEQRSDQVPTLADLRESGAIEQDADVVLFIYREEKVKKETEKKGVAEVIIAKQRSGPVGNVALKFWEKYTKFDNLDVIHSYEETSPTYEHE